MRAHPASRPLTRLLVALGLGLSTLGLALPAQADPGVSPSPSPSASPSPTVADTPSPSPAPTASTTPTASETPAPSPRPETHGTDARRRAMVLAALPPELRGVVAARMDRSGTRRARAAVAAPEDAVILTSCVAGTAATGSIDLVVGTSATTLRYVLTGPTGATRVGTSRVRDGTAIVTIDRLAKASYRLQVFTGASTTALVDETVRVLACVTTTTACQSATFTNPADNPPVFVIYGSPESEDDGTQFPLATGAQHTARIRSAVIGWAAIDAADLTDPGTGNVTVISVAGSGRLTVPQECRAPFLTQILTRCTTGRTPVAARIDVRHDQTASVRYEIRRIADDEDGPDGRMVASGPLPTAGPGEDTIEPRLPGEGDYVWLAYVGADLVAYETIDLHVYACVTTKVSCKAVTFVNPRRNGPVTVGYYTLGATPTDKDVRVKAGASRKVTVEQSRIGWLAVPTSSYEQFRSGDLEVAELAGDVGSLAVPKGCTPAGSGSGTKGASLADTGSGPGTTGAGLLGLVLLGAGVALTRRRTRG